MEKENELPILKNYYEDVLKEKIFFKKRESDVMILC